MDEAIWLDRPIFVTGAAGLIGSWLAKRLIKSGADRLDRARQGRADRAILERVLGEYEIDMAIHLAPQTIVTIANRNPISTFETNIAGIWNLMEACRRSPKIKQIVIASSDKSYDYKGKPSTSRTRFK